MHRLVLPLILLATAAVYWSVLGNDFITLDDPRYVILNPYVRDGLTGDGVRWAFTTFFISNWHPLTWLSHMADVACFGIDPWGHHLTSVLFHLLNSALLFAVLRRASGRLWESAAVAALFALHPLHVESVAWISERKDVLSTFFGLASLWSYVRYAERPGTLRYAWVLLLYALALLAKPMLVTLPFLLLLLDLWPLARVPGFGNDAALAPGSEGNGPVSGFARAAWTSLVVEKLPLFAVAAAISVVTMVAQEPSLATLDALPLSARIANALASYLGYLCMTFWPLGLSPLYPLPATIPVARAALAVAILALVSLVALRLLRRAPYLMVGWLWFLGALVPVIGLIQVGDQAMADRYTYVPLIGVFIMLAWGVADVARRWRIPRVLVAGLSLGVLAALAVQTRTQVGYWESSETLFRHALDVNESNAFAHDALATALLLDERSDEAELHLRRAVEIDPKNPTALSSLAGILLEKGDVAGGAELAQRAVVVAPWLIEAQLNLALALEREGDLAAAVPHYRAAAEIDPRRPGVNFMLAQALEERGDPRGAAKGYALELELAPDSDPAREGLARMQRRIRDGG